MPKVPTPSEEQPLYRIVLPRAQSPGRHIPYIFCDGTTHFLRHITAPPVGVPIPEQRPTGARTARACNGGAIMEDNGRQATPPTARSIAARAARVAALAGAALRLVWRLVRAPLGWA